MGYRLSGSTRCLSLLELAANVSDILLSILFTGMAYAMVLYIISVGLSITMGLLRIANLAHGAFAMAGGYLLITSS